MAEHGDGAGDAAYAGFRFPPADATWEEIRVTVIGLGREGEALARFLAARGAQVTVTDRQQEHALVSRLTALAGLPIRYALGGHPEWVLDVDVIFVSPGIPRSIPILVDAGRLGVPLSSETELFFHMCPAPIIGITGSSGKTTTATLVGKILEGAGFRTWVGGNIGFPLLGETGRIRPEDKVVSELSSFQLEHLRRSPRVAAVLNITPNHLDRHGTMEDYVAAKSHIMAHQRAGDVAIVGQDDREARRLGLEMADVIPGRAVAWFSGSGDVRRGACLWEGQVTLVGQAGRTAVCRTEKIALRGKHNVLNVLAACAIAAEAGAPAEAMGQAARTFAGVEHRLEIVRQREGVLFVNDSIATSPERSMAGISSFHERIVLLAGGRDKHLPWEEWADLVIGRVSQLVLFGEAAGLIERAVAGAFARAGAAGRGTLLEPATIHRVSTLEEAVRMSVKLTRPGDVVLLSPGGTSYDAFLDFAQRGQRFKEIVQAL